MPKSVESTKVPRQGLEPRVPINTSRSGVPSVPAFRAQQCHSSAVGAERGRRRAPRAWLVAAVQ